MTDYENFPNPPIHEALLDFRVRFDSLPSREKFDQLNSVLSEKYLSGKEIFRYDAKFEFKEGVSSSNHKSNFMGLRFESKGDTFVFQAQVDGFTLSRLKPYRNWTNLVDEAKFAWSLYQNLLRPLSIERIACRYINRFEVDARVFDFSEYLAAAPEVPKNLPQGVSKYLLQLEVPAPSAQATVLLTQVLEGVTGAKAAFVLDIDVSKVASYEIEKGEWWAELEGFRRLKNQFFFESLTEKARNMFR